MNSELSRLRKAVSRSFDLSMALLPGPMRDPVSVGYLLARASDTLADTSGVSIAERKEALVTFGEVLEKGNFPEAEVARFSKQLDHAGERCLLQSLPECLRAYRQLSSDCRGHVREVLEVILSGQSQDLDRGISGTWVAESDAELEDYCWRVAGCVGRFWTRVGFSTLGAGYSDESPETLEALGTRYGKGLQLINILRDLPKDRSLGRCYLPVENPLDPREVAMVARKWRDQAAEWLQDGDRYATALKSRRLRAASGLPARIGWETLKRLDQADAEALERGVKVERSVVWRCLWESLLW
ncbi:farnesyl-diphosphate farnesyltransferase [Haloferula luteola]|uniref:Farnesyl-diphosphate farnesyltransferase n=1 Tax=Haloferula luteola TaxID=595692 RepID=A0A840V2M1_9BACT|nr:phytoene/squalene synthase family protein [Haloferula luteola]MBB5352235.1 farnesyl-diphosphate farnesyltransferase [Haloferula luteola]